MRLFIAPLALLRVVDFDDDEGEDFALLADFFAPLNLDVLADFFATADFDLPADFFAPDDLPEDLPADCFAAPPPRELPLDCFDRLALPLPLFFAMRNSP
jgi:hypothetical protein